MYGRVSDVFRAAAVWKQIAAVAAVLMGVSSAAAGQDDGFLLDAKFLTDKAVETAYSWRTPQPIAEVKVSSSTQTAKDPRVSRYAAGRYVSAYHTGDAADNGTTPSSTSSIYVSISDTNGNSWSEPQQIPAIPGVETDYSFRPEVQTDGAGTHILIYDAYVNEAQRIYTTKSTNDGTSWSTPTEISFPGHRHSRSATIDMDSSSSTWMAAWIAQVGDTATTNVVVARSTNAGQDWQLVQTIPSFAGRPQIKMDPVSGIAVVVFERPGTNRNIGYAVTADNGNTFAISTLNTDSATDSRADYAPRIDFNSVTKSWVAVWGGQNTVGAEYTVQSARAEYTSFNLMDGGLAWSAPASVSSGVDFAGARRIDPWIATDHASNWIALWSSQDVSDPEVPRDLYYITSYNDGTTWTAQSSINRDFYDANITRWANPVLASNRLGHWSALWVNQRDATRTNELQTAVPWSSTTFLSTGEGEFADVQLSATVLTNPIYETQNFRIRYVVTNNGPLTANDLVVQLGTNNPPIFPPISIVSVTGPPEFTLVSDGQSPPYRPQGTIESLESGKSVEIIATFNSSQSGTYTIQSQVTASEIDPNESNNLGIRTRVVIQPAPVIADLSVTKTSYPQGEAKVGEYLGYTITVRNLSTQAAPNVVVNDPLPAGLTFNYASTSQGTWAATSANGRTTVTASLGRIGPGARATFVIATTPQNGYSGATNTACASHPGLDPDPTNNCGSVSVTWNGGGGGTNNADVSILKTASAATVTQGTSFTYTLTARNNGPAPATGVTISDTLPQGINFQSETHSNNATVTRNGNQITAQVGNLAVAATAVVNIAVIPVGTETINNTATVTATSADNDQSNNTSTRSVYVDPVDPSTLADLQVTKTATPSPGTVGTPLVYTLKVANKGPAQATSVTLEDMLPPEMAFQSATVIDVENGTETSYSTEPSYNNGLVTYRIDSLAINTTATLRISVMPLVAGQVVNTASASGQQADLAPENNSASVTTTINPGTAPPTESDLAITAVATPSQGSVGNALVLTLLARNNGPQSAVNLTVTHTLHSTTTLVSAVGPNGNGTVVTGVVRVPINLLGPGVTKSVSITLLPQVNGQLLLDGGIEGNVIDAVPSNNSTSVLVQIGNGTDFEGTWLKIKNKTRNGQIWKVKGSFAVRSFKAVKVPFVAVYFYYSDDEEYDRNTDTLFKAVLYKGIKPGKQKKKSVVLKPTVDPTGKYLFAVIDKDGTDESVVPIEIPIQ